MDLKEILDYLGVDADVADLDSFKAEFGTTFIKRDQVPMDDELAGRIWGKKTGILQKAIEKAAASLGFELPDPTFKTIKHEETILKMAEAINANFEAERETLKSQIKGDGGAVTAEFEKKIKAWEKKFNDSQALLGNVTTEYEQYKEGHTKEKRGSLVKNHFEEAKAALKIAKETDPLKLKGLIAEFHEEYDIQVNDENTEVYPVLKSNGQRVKSSKKASEFASTAELLEGLGLKHKVIDLTPIQKGETGGGKKTTVFSTKKEGEADAYERPVHPNALKAAENEA